ncbi:hypothetical protein Dsin_011028 [Dipteronia sinensis]|uniref:Uncharacterized protein n=1 Tax=Dipteronia sinensis TaxID=43782 RepID=A0AAE0ED52_9ROSI|nr:hypothetical protein Dsin_011028 [Dipteronia sinensis]
MPVLERLPHLEILRLLLSSCASDDMHWGSGGFPKLRLLKLWSAPVSEKVDCGARSHGLLRGTRNKRNPAGIWTSHLAVKNVQEKDHAVREFDEAFSASHL